MKYKSCSWLGLDVLKWGYILILCAVTGTVRGQAKKNNVSIPQKTGKSTIVTHGTIRVNGYLRTIEFPEHVHFVRSYSCLKVQYRFQNRASFGDKNIIASCGHEKYKTLFDKRNKNSGYFRHDGGASDWVHSSNGPSISMIPQQNITICG